MGCDTRYANAADYDALLCAGLDLTDVDVVAEINSFLDIAASDIHAALAAQGECDCTLATWAAKYLQKLNIIDAMVIHHCPCGNRISQEERDAKSLWLESQYELIRSGKIPLCQGDTGVEFPAFGVAQMTYTAWNEEQIISNEVLRKP
jgi:hypothetical protein